METVSKMKYSRTDRLVLGIGYAILGLFVLSIVVPLVYVVLASFMDPTVLNNQGLSFHIKAVSYTHLTLPTKRIV